MDTKKITIKNVNGEYSIDIPTEKVQKTIQGILDCLNGKRNGYGYRKDGHTTLIPAELLKNSIIIFESSELNDEFSFENV